MQFIGIFIAALAGYFIGQDAKKRGMNPWVWGILVFLLLIIFLPIYFIIRKPKIHDGVDANVMNIEDHLTEED